jgi:hypothetical protein
MATAGYGRPKRVRYHAMHKSTCRTDSVKRLAVPTLRTYALTHVRVPDSRPYMKAEKVSEKKAMGKAANSGSLSSPRRSCGG